MDRKSGKDKGQTIPSAFGWRMGTIKITRKLITEEDNGPTRETYESVRTTVTSGKGSNRHTGVGGRVQRRRQGQEDDHSQGDNFLNAGIAIDDPG